MAGLPKKYAKMGFKKGWIEYKKTDAYKRKHGKSKSGSSSKSKSKSSSKSGGKRRMGNSFNMNKIYGAIRKVAIFVPAADIAMQPWSNEAKIKTGVLWYFGWDSWNHKFNWSALWNGWGPAVGAQVITRAIPAINKFIRGFF